MSSERRPTPHPEVAAYSVDDELVVYDDRQGQGFVLNSTAARIWALCDASRTTEEITQAIAAEYGLDYADALADVSECLEHLQRARLLQ
jgi:PqqD family protein of HPr-rel-A system